MSSEKRHWECYFKCATDGVLHRFPNPHNNEDRFNLWTKVLDTDMQKRDSQYIYNCLRLCDKHFELCYRTPSKKLTRNAIPTLNIDYRQAANQPLLMDEFILSQASIKADDTPSVPALDDMTQPLLKIDLLVNMVRGEVPCSLGDISNICLPDLETPSASKEILQSADTFKAEKQMLRKVYKIENKLKELSDKYKTQCKKIKHAKNLSRSKHFLKCIEKLPESIQVFTKMQMKMKYKPRGRRCLQKQLSLIPLRPGINPQIFNHIKKTVKRLPMEKRLCTLIFDEVALEPGLHFDKGQIIGFEDFGHKNTNQIADHALVFMLISIKGKFKQPICYTFCKSCTKKDNLKYLIKSLIKEVHKTGLKIIATICDQSQSNVSVVKSLREDTRKEYLKQGLEHKSCSFEIENCKIFPLFDTPHLLKGVRNNLLNKDAKFIEDGVEKIAKWEHIKMLFNEDVGEHELRLVNKLTEFHINKDKIPKMKVKFAAQVFSQRVSSAIRFLASHKILPTECQDTASFLLMFDKLFDSFNGHTYSGTEKKFTGCLKNVSPHVSLWKELVTIIKSIKFITVIKNKDGTEKVKYEKVPSTLNWAGNIETFLEMWEMLQKEHNVTSLLTRNFNQDPLENFFCCIRSNGVRNTNPTCAQFINAYKTLLVNNLSSPHSVNANCEADDNKCLQSLSYLLKSTTDSVPQEENINFNIDLLIEKWNKACDEDQHNIIHNESKRYVAGYIIKRCQTKIFKSCKVCKNIFLMIK
ncbi:unnamed protein product [Parnassius mnemosyne]|uniref:THAP-type domain-containing protein n=1 Tax=Parnassius mnemosyne TaxID=213953 RepID=A0AAV1LTS7_9NEOP